MNEVTIRSAAREDSEAIADLTRQLGYASDPASARARLDGLLRSGDDSVLVAVAGGLVAGWLHVNLERSLESEEFAEIRGLVVGERFRSGGIGRQLVGAAEDWARARGLTRIRVRSNVIRKDAHRFYEREGYQVVKQQCVFDKVLSSRD